MGNDLRDLLWRQFGGAVQMLDNAMAACPPEVWGERLDPFEFWYIAYHTLFWLDHYASESPEGFRPPAPFGLSELDPAGLLPERVYSPAELRGYLAHGREKGRALIRSLSGLDDPRRFVNARRDYSLPELVIYNTRHVQHHTAQLNLLLRQRTGRAPEWVSHPAQGLDG